MEAVCCAPIRFSSEDLPAEDGARIARNWPRGTVRETSFTAHTSTLPRYTRASSYVSTMFTVTTESPPEHDC